LVLDRYRAALSQLDSQMARAVWPGVNVKALAHAFDQLESQKVEFGRCDIAVDGGRATATCSGTAVYVPKVGSKAPRTDARSWSFALQQNGDRWQIQRVESH
jgi:hypothetical protein